MTTEIAILNKSATALAADSAVTIGNGIRHTKIYNTGNKIFEICPDQPIALMVYGSLRFMGLPLEVLAKQYRAKRAGKVQFKTIKSCALDFLDYLKNDVPTTQAELDRSMDQILSACYYDAAKKVDQIIRKDIQESGRYLPSKFNKIASEVIDLLIETRKKKLPIEPFLEGRPPRLLVGYEDRAREIAKTAFGGVLFNMTNSTMGKLLQLARHYLHRQPLSPNLSGLVFCGFGEQEICPSLECFEIDGLAGGEIRRVPTQSVDIGRDSVGADIQAFAQKNVVERFLQGIDPDLSQEIIKIQKQNLILLRDALAGAIVDAGGPRLNRAAIEPILSDIVDKQLVEPMRDREQDNRRAILSMVEFMPNQELAMLAESLVELTSLNHRVSPESETVGGEVDVAVISKSEGLVWIKRKHYFPAELNPRFHKRHYKRQEPGDDKTKG